MLSGQETLALYARETFYAGKPTTVEPYRLVWDDVDYRLEVIADGDQISAVMTSGACEWTTQIDASQFVSDVDAALEDACRLGRVANFIPDPERN